MLADVDRAVAALLESERLGGQAAKVAFDAPKKEWAAARTAPTLNLFLADIREDLTRRTTTLIEEVGENGIVESRRQPFRLLQPHVLLTAWASRPEDDHQLLGLALRALVQRDYIPRAIFVQVRLAALLEQSHNLHLRVGGKDLLRPLRHRNCGRRWVPTITRSSRLLSACPSLPVSAEPASPPQTVPPQVARLQHGRSRSGCGRGRDPQAPGQESEHAGEIQN